jgi:predicted nucleotidyltransferase
MHQATDAVTPDVARVARVARVVRDAVAAEPRVAAAYVYGSVARGQATPLSDLDVAVVVATEVPEEERGALQRRLMAALARRFPRRRADVRLFDELPIAIRGRALRDGRRVFDRDPVLRVREEVKTRMAYHDFLLFETAVLAEGLAGLRRKAAGG